jgi:hypothetical protein
MAATNPDWVVCDDLPNHGHRLNDNGPCVNPRPAERRVTSAPMRSLKDSLTAAAMHSASPAPVFGVGPVARLIPDVLAAMKRENVEGCGPSEDDEQRPETD